MWRPVGEKQSRGDDLHPNRATVSTLTRAKASNLIAIASTLVAMASNLIAMASNLC